MHGLKKDNISGSAVSILILFILTLHLKSNYVIVV